MVEEGGNGSRVFRRMEGLLYKRVVGARAFAPGQGQGGTPH